METCVAKFDATARRVGRADPQGEPGNVLEAILQAFSPLQGVILEGGQPLWWSVGFRR